MTFASIVTTINYPTESLKTLYNDTHKLHGESFIIGDKKTPDDFKLGDSRFYSLKSQLESDYSLAKILPQGHYSRKNLGYLECIRLGFDCIYETDDDNAPKKNWKIPSINRTTTVYTNMKSKWINVYKLFTDENIWPRGLPLNEINNEFQFPQIIEDRTKEYPIQQGLADIAPDVDAVWRLVFNKNVNFEKNEIISIEKNFWCPFNSQNTWWFKSAFLLMYLPSYCSFRMTDIWRSFIAQRCLWEIDSELLFFGSDVNQERNIHDLMKDFKDEIPGYLLNENIIKILINLELSKGQENVADNLLRCYTVLVENNIFEKEELDLVNAWINDFKNIIK
jgi:hypothetical protein